MARILVTGLEGFTGAYLLAALRRHDHQVVGLVRDAAQAQLPGDVELSVCDLNDLEMTADAIAAIRPERVIHLAGISFVGHDDVDEMYATNLLGTRHLLEALRRTRIVPSAVILASSANVYGNRTSGVIDESLDPDPVNDYAASKLAMEFMARTYRADLPIIIARPFNYTGIGQSKDFVIPKIVDSIRCRQAGIELGNIDVCRDWSDVRSVAEIYARLVDQKAAIGQVVNICSGVATSLRDVLAIAQRVGGHALEVTINPQFARSREVASLCGSTVRRKALTGAVPAIEIDDTLRWMIETP